MSPEVAATLYDALGEVEWFVIDRATHSGLRIRQLELPVAKLLKQYYRGSVLRKRHYANWLVTGRDSELFAEVILPYLHEKKNLVEQYMFYRNEIINADGRGRSSTLDEEALALRKEVEHEFARLQGKEK